MILGEKWDSTVKITVAFTNSNISDKMWVQSYVLFATIKKCKFKSFQSNILWPVAPDVFARSNLN